MAIYSVIDITASGDTPYEGFEKDVANWALTETQVVNLKAGTTAQILVGGGATVTPVWTTATGTGAPVRATSPTLVTPALGTPASGVATNLTGLPLTTGVTGVLPVANGGTNETTSTGTGAIVKATSPTLVTPILGTPTSGVATNLTGLPLTTGVTGVLPVANGGTGSSTATGTLIQSKTSNQSNTTVTLANITDLTIALTANQILNFHAYLVMDAAATTTGIYFDINGPATPTLVCATLELWSAASTRVFGNTTAWAEERGNTSSAGTDKRIHEIFGTVINGANAGTFAIRFRSEIADSAVTCYTGSWVLYLLT